MAQHVLEELGLTPNEAKIYTTLLHADSANVSTIARESNVHRRNVYDAMERLIEKGLVSEQARGGEKVYTAVDPSVLKSLLREKEKKLDSVLPDLRQAFDAHEADQQAFIYEDIPGFKNYLQLILEEGEDVYSFGSKNGWGDARLEPYVNQFYDTFHGEGLKVYNLFDHEMHGQVPDFLRERDIPYKFLPEEYTTDSAIDIFGDYIVTFTGLHPERLEDDITLFVIKSARLADAYRTWFQLIWDLLSEAEEEN